MRRLVTGGGASGALTSQPSRSMSSTSTSIAETSADLPAVEACLNVEFPATVDFHYLHDVKAGTWRIIPIEPARLVRATPA